MAKPGPKIKELDRDQFEKLCAIFCTKEEIFSWFKVSKSTLERWVKRTYKADFETVYKTYSEHGKISLRREQMKVAMKGNVTMLIWLGKQILKQTENPAADDSREVPAPVFSIVRREA